MKLLQSAFYSLKVYTLLYIYIIFSGMANNIIYTKEHLRFCKNDNLEVNRVYKI